MKQQSVKPKSVKPKSETGSTSELNGPTSLVNQLIVLGAGYLGQKVALQAVERGFQRVVGIRRQQLSLAHVDTLALDLLESEGQSSLKALCKSLVTSRSSDSGKLQRVGIFYCLSPDSGDEDAYRSVYQKGLSTLLRILDESGAPEEFHVVLASSTSVYQDHDGSWVDESTTDERPPTHGTGRMIYEGERLLRHSTVQSTILRFGGIYGPERRYFVERVRHRQEPLFDGQPLFSNRIHVHDAATMVHFCLQNRSCHGQTFNGVDCDPAARNDVIQYLWSQFGDSRITLEHTSNLSAIRHRGNKRVKSEKIRSLGFSFKFPSYKEGYGF